MRTTGIEGSFRLSDPRTGLMGRVMLGYGRNLGGTLDDKDFLQPDASDPDDDLPPELYGAAFSSTRSELDNRQTFYGALDIGMTFPVRDTGVRLTPFFGYFRMKDSYLARGATARPDDVGGLLNGPPGTPLLGPDELAIGTDITWEGMRLGVDAEVPLGERTYLAVSLAGIPGNGSARIEDSHFQRIELGPVPNFITESDEAWAFQSDVTMGYRIDERLSLTFGIRYWRFGSGEGRMTTILQTPDESPETSPDSYILERLSGRVGLVYQF